MAIKSEEEIKALVLKTFWQLLDAVNNDERERFERLVGFLLALKWVLGEK